MIYVKRITSTVQGGIDAELGPKTIIIGPNASKKTAITRSVELALTGIASDIQGRDEVAKTIELLTLAPPDQDLVATAILSDGTSAKFELKRKTAKKGEKVTSSVVPPLRPKSVDPEKVFPLRTLREAILGKADTARKFFLSHSTRAVTRQDVLDRLPESLHANYLQAVQGSGVLASQPELDKLLAALEWAHKRAGELGREATAAQATTNKLGQGLPPPPTETDYAEARQRLRDAQGALENAVAAYQLQTHQADTQERIRGLHAQLEDSKIQLGKAKSNLAFIESEAAKLPPIPPEPQGLTPGQLAVVNSILWHAEQKAPICYCCRTNVPPTEWASRAEVARQELRQAEARVITDKENRRLLVAQHAKKDELLASARFDVEQWAAAVKAREEALTQVHGAVQQTPQNGAPEVLSIENARMAVQAAEQRLSEMDRANAAWESTKKARDAGASAEAEGNRYAQLTDACNNVVRELLDYGVQSFCEKVQIYLPARDRFGLRLRDGGREVCQFGLYHGDQLHTALSGAEWARVTAALAAVCGSSAQDQLVVIKPEERAFDPITLSEVLLAFARAPQQILMESPIRPAQIPPGWTLIELAGPVAPVQQKPPPSQAAISPALYK